MNGEVGSLLKALTGKTPPFGGNWDSKTQALFDDSGIGYSQFNELMLLFGYDRVSPSLFQFLYDGTAHFIQGSTFKSLDHLREGVERFQLFAILLYGNIKFAFNWLNERDEDEFDSVLLRIQPYDIKPYTTRHEPLLPITLIPGELTYYLGYIVADELKRKLQTSPTDNELQKEMKLLQETIEIGKQNQKAYLASDHMDVYVATSMRERHEYIEIHELVKSVFKNLEDLKLRYFDPTQAYCDERIDKGLAEALMLKRAECTLYLAQESDTLGKDSELASTLAQGKPVIAYIPEITESEQSNFVEQKLANLRLSFPEKSDCELVLNQLNIYSPSSAWEDPTIIKWINSPQSMDLEEAKKRLGQTIRKHYDRRAKILKRDHPLGIQVDLNSGLANGVLVARNPLQCSELIRKIMTNTLKFKVKVEMKNDRKYYYLEETTSESVYRVVTGDEFLTNVFWNYYLLE